MIDVHIIQHPSDDRAENIERLLKALEFEPVKVHVVKGVYRQIGIGRFNGFRSGEQEIVTYIDDDDDFVPGIFDKILARFEQEPELDALCTREEAFRNGKPLGAPRAHFFKYYEPKHLFALHHMAVFKRKAIEPHLWFIKDVQDGSEHGLWAKLMLDGARIAHLPEVGYKWMIHDKSTPHLRLAVPEKVHELYYEVHKLFRKPPIPEQAELVPISRQVRIERG